MSFASFMRAVKADASYNETNKAAFHSESKKVLRALAKALKLEKGQFDLRSNMGGIAVSGEVTLHSDNLYIQFQQSVLGGTQFMWRTCKGRKDYTGGQNQWMKWDDLKDIQKVADYMNKVVAASSQSSTQHLA
jgi:hypothetical protein